MKQFNYLSSLVLYKPVLYKHSRKKRKLAHGRNYCIPELVEECKEMEEWFGSTFTDIILSRSLGSIREMKKEILELDKKVHVDRYLEKAPMVAEVSRRIGWARLWDAALDFGWKSVKGLKLLSRAFSYHGKGNHPCHLYDTAPH